MPSDLGEVYSGGVTMWIPADLIRSVPWVSRPVTVDKWYCHSSNDTSPKLSTTFRNGTLQMDNQI